MLYGESEDTKNSIDKHERNLLSMEKPNSWNINKKGNLEIEMETEFEKFMYAISEHTTEDISKITVFRFYALTDYIKEKNSKNGNN